MGSARGEPLAGCLAKNGCSGTPKSPRPAEAPSCPRTTDARHAKIATTSVVKRNPDLTFPAAIPQNAACTEPTLRLQDDSTTGSVDQVPPGLCFLWASRVGSCMRHGNASIWPRHPELGKKKGILIRELFNSLAQRRADSMSGASAGSQQDRTV